MNTRKIANEYRLQSWGQALHERAADQESIKVFCERKGISKNTYYYWQRKLRKAAIERLSEVEPASRFTEVKLSEKAVEVTPCGIFEASQLCIENGGVKITTDSSYRMEKLAALCRELTRT